MFNLLNLFKTKKKQFRSNKLSNAQTKKIYGKTNEELCKKYKGKSVRKTPKNWAYNTCVKRKYWQNCKKLPPQGWNMHRYFCE